MDQKVGIAIRNGPVRSRAHLAHEHLAGHYDKHEREHDCGDDHKCRDDVGHHLLRVLPVRLAHFRTIYIREEPSAVTTGFLVYRHQQVAERASVLLRQFARLHSSRDEHGV